MLNYLIECFDRVGIEEKKAPKVIGNSFIKNKQRGKQNLVICLINNCFHPLLSIHSCIQSIKWLLSIYYVPGTVLGTWGMNKTDEDPLSSWNSHPGGGKK